MLWANQCNFSLLVYVVVQHLQLQFLHAHTINFKIFFYLEVFEYTFLLNKMKEYHWLNIINIKLLVELAALVQQTVKIQQQVLLIKCPYSDHLKLQNTICPILIHIQLLTSPKEKRKIMLNERKGYISNYGDRH